MGRWEGGDGGRGGREEQEVGRKGREERAGGREEGGGGGGERKGREGGRAGREGGQGGREEGEEQEKVSHRIVAIAIKLLNAMSVHEKVTTDISQFAMFLASHNGTDLSEHWRLRQLSWLYSLSCHTISHTCKM